MRASIEEYKAVEQAAMKFVRSVAEGDSTPARELFIDEAVLFGYLDGRLEHGSIEQFYHNVDTVAAGQEFRARVDVLDVEEKLAVVRVLEEGRPHRLHRLSADDEDGWPVALRRKGLQPEFRYH